MTLQDTKDPHKRRRVHLSVDNIPPVAHLRNLDPARRRRFDIVRGRQQALCIGYIDGIVDSNAMMQGFLGVQLFCPSPGGISLDQAMRIFLKWANDHPEQLHESARISVMLSLAQAFPCAR